MKKILFIVLLTFSLVNERTIAQPKLGKTPTVPSTPQPPSKPSYEARNVLNDATFLLDTINNDIEKRRNILRYYFSFDSSLPANPYLVSVDEIKAVIDGLNAAKNWNTKQPVQLSGTTVTSAVESIFSPVKIADGLGTFIADRFKEELTMRYIKAFRDSLVTKDAKYHYSVLLPKTYNSLETYDNIFDYKQFITALKEAFKDDLDHLASNGIPFLQQTIKSPANLQDFYLFLALADYTVNKIPNGESPLNIFDTAQHSSYLSNLPANVKAAMQLAQAIGNNLRDARSQITTQNLEDLISNPTKVKVIIGLLICKDNILLNKITTGTGNAYSYLKSANVATMVDDLIEIIKAVKKIQSEINGYANTQEKKLSDLLKVINTTSLSVKKILIRLDKPDSAKIESTYQQVSIVANILEYSDEQKYGLMVTELLKLLDALNVKKGNAVYDNLHKYGPFIANIAQAKTGAEVKEVLESAALPVGSYKIKRGSFADISLNAYAGLFAGVEHYMDNFGSSINQDGFTYGFTAPVGLSFSWGIKEKGPAKGETSVSTFKYKKVDYHLTGKSGSIFVSIIDVGAITSFRLANDQTKALPEFSWGNILAPGLYYIKGWKDSPLTWGVGGQYGPQLRAIKDSSAVIDGSSLSFRVFVAVDVPIFSFFTRTTPK